MPNVKIYPDNWKNSKKALSVIDMQINFNFIEKIVSLLLKKYLLMLILLKVKYRKKIIW